MRIRLIIPLSLLAAAILFSILMISGCGNLDIEGPQPGNNAPWVKWAITPSDSMVHSFNPTLQWFGGDTDGLINDYMFGVFQAAYMDSATRETSLEIPDTLTWISLGIVTEATIPLVASPDSSVSVGQYVVMRGVDDQGDTSNVINRYLLRTNNRPTCIVTVPEDPQWVLPDTTSTWFGIPITWEGGDSLDYPDAQPDFLWEVHVYGPYPDSTTVHNDTINFDPATAPYRYSLVDNDDDPLRIAGTGFNFLDLRTGFYIIYVRNYDDANVPSAPALGIFEVYEPHWIYHPGETKDILIVSHSSYQGQYYGELEPEHRDSVEQFYTEMVLAAGFTQNDFDWFDGEAEFVNRDTLYKYRMVMALDTDWRNQIPDDQQAEYAEYLDVGGKIWIIGRRSFDLIPASSSIEYGATGLPFSYINLDGAFLNASNDPNQVDFTGASPLIADLPQLEVDTLRVSYTSWPLNNYAEALYGVGFLITLGECETIYLYDALEPSTSSYQDFPVAVRYDAGTYKTAYFAFPLYFIEDAAAFQAAETMLDWFLQE